VCQFAIYIRYKKKEVIKLNLRGSWFLLILHDRAAKKRERKKKRNKPILN